MKARIFLALTLLSGTFCAAQSYVNLTTYSRQIAVNVSGPDASINEKGLGITSRQISWNPFSSSACSLQGETSPDGITWTILGVSQTCTSAGSYQLPGATTNYFRMNITAFAGNTLTVRYFGFAPAPVSASSSTSDVNIAEVGGNPVTTTVPVSGTVSVSGTVTANQGTSPWVTSVSNFPATQPVSGTVTANQGTSPWVTSVSNFPATQPVSGTVTANQGTSPWVTSVSNFPATVAVTQSTSPWVTSVNNFPATQPVSGTVALTKTQRLYTTTAPTSSATSFYGPNGNNQATSAAAGWWDATTFGDNLITIGITSSTFAAAGSNGFYLSVADDSSGVTAINAPVALIPASSAAVNAVFNNFLGKRYYQVKIISGAAGTPTFEMGVNAMGTGNPVPYVNVTTGALILGGLNIGDNFTNSGVGPVAPSINVNGTERAAPIASLSIYSQSGTAGPFVYARTPSTFKTVAAVSVTSGTPVGIWTPTSGKKFRIMNWCVSLSVAGAVIFKDTSATEVFRTPLMPAGIGQCGPFMGNGYISLAVNNVLDIDVTSTGTVTGYVDGTEE
jgi:hypothetical protein